MIHIYSTPVLSSYVSLKHKRTVKRIRSKEILPCKTKNKKVIVEVEKRLSINKCRNCTKQYEPGWRNEENYGGRNDAALRTKTKLFWNNR